MSVRAMVRRMRNGEKPRSAKRRDSITRNAARRSSAVKLPARTEALPMSWLSRLNRWRCSPGMRLARVAITGNENRHRVTVSRATALQG